MASARSKSFHICSRSTGTVGESFVGVAIVADGAWLSCSKVADAGARELLLLLLLLWFACAIIIADSFPPAEGELLVEV